LLKDILSSDHKYKKVRSNSQYEKTRRDVSYFFKIEHDLELDFFEDLNLEIANFQMEKRVVFSDKFNYKSKN